MDSKTMATILYEMTKDMDYADYEEYREQEECYLAIDIDKLKENDSPLYFLLETLAEQNDFLLER